MTLTPSNYDILKQGQSIPKFKLPGVDGKKYGVDNFKGKKGLLVVFMANHCPYAKPKFSWLVELQSRYGPRGIQLVAISSNDPSDHPEDSFDNMKSFAKEEGALNFPYLYDESQDVAKSFGGTCTPDPFLFDGDLRLVYHGRIDDAHAKPHEAAKTNELEDAIKQLLSGTKVDVQWIPSFGCNIKWKPGNEPTY